MHAANSTVVEPRRQSRYFALCESCFWSATVLREVAVKCPSCPEGNVSLSPLAINEEYRLRLSPSAGLEMSFSRYAS